MKKIDKNTDETYGIKNYAVRSAHQRISIESLKDKVQSDQKVLVAVSGGADSMVSATLMYNFFIRNKYNLHNLFFIHCNHNVRKGNQEDELFVRKFFQEVQLIVKKRSKAKKGTESELRDRRYGEFMKTIREHQIDRLVLGHNLTDRIESTFLNLLRGANLNGFIGMQGQESHHLLPGTRILRPILRLTKQEVLKICSHTRLPFVTDPTNIDTGTSLRNKLRNHVLPQIYALSHKQTPSSNTFIESMKNIYDQLDQEKGQEESMLIPIQISPHRNARFAYQWNIAPEKISTGSLMHVMKTLHISNNITARLLKEWIVFLERNESGYKYFNKTYLFKSHGNIYFISGPEFFRKKTIDRTDEIHTLGAIDREGKKIEITKKEYIGMTIRFPKKGDRYRKKTWNEYCINQKIPIFRRNFIPLIVDRHEIVKILKDIR